MFHQVQYHVQDNKVPSKNYQFVHLLFSIPQFLYKLENKIILFTCLTNMNTNTFALDNKFPIKNKKICQYKNAPTMFFYDQIRYALLDCLHQQIDNMNTLRLVVVYALCTFFFLSTYLFSLLAYQ